MPKLDFVYRTDKNAMKVMSTRTFYFNDKSVISSINSQSIQSQYMMWPSYGVIIQLNLNSL